MTLHPSASSPRILEEKCRPYSALAVQYEGKISHRKVERHSPLPRIPQSALHRCDSLRTLLSTSWHRSQQLIARPTLRTCCCFWVRFTPAYVFVMTSTCVCYRILFLYKLPHETWHKNSFLLLALMSVVILKIWMLFCACARFGKANVLNAITTSSVISRMLAVKIAYKLILGANQGPFYFSQSSCRREDV